MSKKRQFSSEFKVNVVLELLKEEQTLGEIAAAYQINPNQLSTWRREFLERAPGLFDESKAMRAQRKADHEAAAERDRLLKTVGQLTMERDFLQAIQTKREENRRLL